MINLFCFVIFVCFLGLLLYRAIKGQIWISKRSIPGNIVTKEDYLLYLRFQKMYEFVADYISAKLPTNSHTPSILEIGCGIGYGTQILVDKLRKPIRATDAEIGVRREAATIIDLARLKYTSPLITFEHGLIEDEPSNTYDFVLCFQTVEHMPDDKSFVTHLNRILKVGGVAFVATINRTYRLKDNQKPWNKDHIREYNYKSLNKLLSLQFKTIKMYGLTGTTKVTKIEYNRVRGPKLRKDLRRIFWTLVGFNEKKYGTYMFNVGLINNDNCLDLLAVVTKE